MRALKSIPGRRLAAVAILAVIVGLFSLLVVAPITNYFFSLQLQLEDQRRLLGRFTEFTGKRDEAAGLASRIHAARQRGVFLDGDTDALRTAKLQSLLVEAARDDGIRIRTSRTLSSIERDGVQLLGVEALMAANIRQIQALLIKLEQRWPYLFVHTLQIGQPTSRQPGNDKLEFRIGVVGVVPQFDDKET